MTKYVLGFLGKICFTKIVVSQWIVPLAMLFLKLSEWIATQNFGCHESFIFLMTSVLSIFSIANQELKLL